MATATNSAGPSRLKPHFSERTNEYKTTCHYRVQFLLRLDRFIGYNSYHMRIIESFAGGGYRQLNIPMSHFFGLSDSFFNHHKEEVHRRRNEGENYSWREVDSADWEAWLVFHYWIMKRELPVELKEDQMLLVRCWCIGEYYWIRDFMSDVMFRLLRYFDNEENIVSIDAVRLAFCKTQHNALDKDSDWTKIRHPRSIRFVMAEELLYSPLIDSAADITKHGLNQCDCEGENCGMEELPFVLSFVELVYQKNPGPMANKFRDGLHGGPAEWMYRMEGQKWKMFRMFVQQRLRIVTGEPYVEPPGSVLQMFEPKNG